MVGGIEVVSTRLKRREGWAKANGMMEGVDYMGGYWVII